MFLFFFLFFFFLFYLIFGFISLFFILDSGERCDVTSHIMVTQVTVTIIQSYDTEKDIKDSGTDNVIIV